MFFVVVGTRRNRNASSQQGGGGGARVDTGQPTLFTFNIVKEFDHDPRAFTQGFEVYHSKDNGPTFIESTGLRGRSSVREVDIATGKVLRSTDLIRTDFGEGITRLGDTLYQLTWQSPRLISYNVHDFSKQQVHKTSLKDGWGITNDGSRLILGDSSHVLYFVDPKTMKVVDTIDVTDADKPVAWLNELEWVDGLIYANIWQRECIAQIEPTTGNIVGWIDLSGITRKVRAASKEKIDVLNGIAWDGEDGTLYITGKLWPKVYQIELRPMYVDSKTTHVKEMTESVRQRCIVSS